MTPKRRAELRVLLATAPEFIREDPLVRDMPALLDALDMADARERRLREALDRIVAENHASRISSVQRAVGIARAALSEVAPDAR